MAASTSRLLGLFTRGSAPAHSAGTDAAPPAQDTTEVLPVAQVAPAPAAQEPVEQEPGEQGPETARERAQRVAARARAAQDEAARLRAEADLEEQAAAEAVWAAAEAQRIEAERAAQAAEAEAAAAAAQEEALRAAQEADAEAAAERAAAEQAAAEEAAREAARRAEEAELAEAELAAHPPQAAAPEDVTVFVPAVAAPPVPETRQSRTAAFVGLATGGWMRGQGERGADAAALLTPAVAAPLATLEGRNITAWFGDHQVLDRVSLTMHAGIITSLIGPSGCGKSTFLRILNRMHELVPSASLAGEVLLDGVDIYDPTRKLVDARKEIGMVFQKPNPFPAQSIYDNVIAGLKLTGTHASRDEKDALVESCLTKAGLWKEVKDRLRAPGAGLSGGQQQRLCIARSLAVRPRVLLMDEPCSALDPTSTRVIEETMLELAHEVTIVIVTHNMQQAQRVSQQCAFFLASQGTPGAIVEHGDTEAMFSDPIDPRTYDYVNGVFG